MVAKVAINGFGRIGRQRACAEFVESGRKDIEVVAINDLGPGGDQRASLRYDSVHGRFPAQGQSRGRHDRDRRATRSR